MSERTIPILPCRSLDDVLPFYEALEFEVTYRQARPNPYAVVRLEGIELHFCEPEGFEPETSYGSVVIVVPDADSLYRDFADRLRAAYGRLPSSGIPRILRPRKKLGTVAGFSVVDPGGNWLRVYRSGDHEDAQDHPQGLALVLRSAARQGDSRGDEAVAAKMLDAGLARHATPTLRQSSAYPRSSTAPTSRSGWATSTASARRLPRSANSNSMTTPRQRWQPTSRRQPRSNAASREVDSQ